MSVANAAVWAVLPCVLGCGPSLAPVEGDGSGSGDDGALTDDTSAGRTGAEACTDGLGLGWDWIDRLEGGEGGPGGMVDVLPVEQDVVLLGATDPFAPSVDLRRYDTRGVLQWSALGPDGTAIPRGAVLTSGDIVVCARQTDTGGTWLARLSAAGQEQWSMSLPDLYACSGISADAEGGFVLVSGREAARGEYSQVVERRDAEGTLVWRYTAASGMPTEVHDVATASDGFAVVGRGVATGSVWLGMIDGDGELSWSAEDSDPAFADRTAEQLVVTDSGDIVLVGRGNEARTYDEDLLLWRYGPDGSLAWVVQHDLGAPNEQPFGLRLAPDGELLVAGRIGAYADDSGGAPTTFSPLLASFSTEDGALLWQDTASIDDEGVATGLIADDCGGLIVSGIFIDALDEPRPWLGRYRP